MYSRVHIATDDVFEIMRASDKPWGDFMKALLISRHGEDHRRMRDALKPFFKARRIAEHVGLIRQLFCASDMSIFMTGRTLLVDAGETV